MALLPVVAVNLTQHLAAGWANAQLRRKQLRLHVTSSLQSIFRLEIEEHNARRVTQRSIMSGKRQRPVLWSALNTVT